MHEKSHVGKKSETCGKVSLEIVPRTTLWGGGSLAHRPPPFGGWWGGGPAGASGHTYGCIGL